MAFGLSSAKSYASASGTSSHVAVGSSTSGSSSALSSMESAHRKLEPNIEKRYGELPSYGHRMAMAGDVFFHVDGARAGHANMMARDTNYKIDSVDPVGVRMVPLHKDGHPAVVYRFHDASVAQRAALLAEDWAGKVKYSDGAFGTGITFRVLGAVFGSCKFGIGAEARLMKYRNQDGMAPKNVICSEMCVLAYQLSMSESDLGFPKLDAKHTLPTDLMKYFEGAGSAHWKPVGIRQDRT